MSKTALDNVQGKAMDMSDKDKKVQQLESLREAIVAVASWNEITKTDKVKLASVYNGLKLKLNQGELW